jgi:MoxR-like ATPase
MSTSDVVQREKLRPGLLNELLMTTIVGQHSVVEALILAIIAGGHVLLEGPPGLAKTLSCRALAHGIGGAFKRVQFTPDLLPSDVVGTRIFDQRTGEFRTSLGPIFANIVLADEINRAPAKVQSALLEAMQERQVTIGTETHRLPEPFIVMATMNPLDSDGTYALPQAQMDRFLMKILVDYPSASEELTILNRFSGGEPPMPPSPISIGTVQSWRDEAREIHMDDKIKRYIVGLVGATRETHTYIDRGASPRATLALASIARARALVDGRTFVIPDDVRTVAVPVLRHRVSFSYRAATERVNTEEMMDDLIASVPTP